MTKNFFRKLYKGKKEKQKTDFKIYSALEVAEKVRLLTIEPEQTEVYDKAQ